MSYAGTDPLYEASRYLGAYSTLQRHKHFANIDIEYAIGKILQIKKCLRAVLIAPETTPLALGRQQFGTYDDSPSVLAFKELDDVPKRQINLKDAPHTQRRNGEYLGPLIGGGKPPCSDRLTSILCSCVFCVIHRPDVRSEPREELTDDGTVFEFLKVHILYWLEINTVPSSVSSSLGSVQFLSLLVQLLGGVLSIRKLQHPPKVRLYGCVCIRILNAASYNPV